MKAQPVPRGARKAIIKKQGAACRACAGLATADNRDGIYKLKKPDHLLFKADGPALFIVKNCENSYKSVEIFKKIC